MGEGDAPAPSDGAGKSGDEDKAARVIQRNYRGHRTRRELNGIGLDASSRWAEVRNRLAYLRSHNTHKT
jgi:hypothetical protein